MLAFPAEIYRTGVNTTVRTLKEIKDPIRKQNGYNNLVGSSLQQLDYYNTREQIALKSITNVVEDNTILPVENGKYKYIEFNHGFFL